MLEELSLTLPERKNYEQTLPMTKTLESSLIDLYTEIICFYASAVHFFRSNPHIVTQRQSWSDFEGDFKRTMKVIGRLSSAVKSEADLARMTLDMNKYQEVLSLVKDLKDSKMSDDTTISHCYCVPCDPSPRFWNRCEAIKATETAFSSEEPSTSFRSFALYGMGGVGKTRIAIQYANQNRDRCDSVIWIAAESVISMGQSARNAAKALSLISSDEAIKDLIGATSKLKAWLRETRSHWLMLLDNADDLDLLAQIWPTGAARGSILITSRDFNSANHPASAGYHVQPFDNLTGSQILLRLLGLDGFVADNQQKALVIAETLGGLLLALTQIAGFISQRRMNLTKFIQNYEQSSAKIDATKSNLTKQDHTLSNLWELSLSKLSGPAYQLENLMAFFSPDGIEEKMLLDGARAVTSNNFEFLSDEMDLGDAEEILLQAALIEKTIEDSSLSTHRLIQAAVMRRLSISDRTKYFDVAVQILSCGLPDTWSKDTGHEFKSWTQEAWIRYDKCLPHTTNLVLLSKKYQIRAGNGDKFGELLIPCASYLNEREYYDVARGLVDVAVQSFNDKDSLAFASASNLSGLVALNVYKPSEAIDPFNLSMAIRKKHLALDDSLIAWNYNNLGLAYTEMSRFSEALAMHEKAMEIRLRTDNPRIGNSYSNMSSLCLRMGRVDEAETYLYKCPALKGFTDETFLNTNNPRFSGDMVLLSRIRQAQGRSEDAMRLATKALDFRRKLLGNRFRTCDSLYDVAGLLHRDGKSGSALDMLQELVAISEGLPGGEGQLARANYKLSVLYGQMGRQMESEACKQRALALRRKLVADDEDSPFEEDRFMMLCPWMLW